MGGCSVAGRVEVGDFATLGTNATVLPDAQVGKNAYVGAGAVVLRKVLDNEVVAGVPAKRIGERKLMMTSDPIGACR
jgi:acetyltransferase-like isoleucine patch superfamily enzyme